MLLSGDDSLLKIEAAMSQQIPKLLFVGAGNIAQSIMKGIIKAQPTAAKRILATAPSPKNLDIVKKTLGCETTLLADAFDSVHDFKPDFVFLCMKPQVLMASISNSEEDLLTKLISNTCIDSITLSLLAGVKSEIFTTAFSMPKSRIVRVMLNTAAEIGSTSVLYHADRELNAYKACELEGLFKLIGQAIVRLNDENLMDVATGVCGSGIAFFYEMIQTISDIGVKNGLSRSDATLVAAQLSKSAGEMLLEKRLHPYQLRDDVTSPAGTTIHGLHCWHENSTGLSIGRAFQASIDKAKSLSTASQEEFRDKNNRIRAIIKDRQGSN